MRTSLIRSMVCAMGLMVLAAGMAGTALAVDPPSVPELDPGSIAMP